MTLKQVIKAPCAKGPPYTWREGASSSLKTKAAKKQPTNRPREAPLATDREGTNTDRHTGTVTTDKDGDNSEAHTGTITTVKDGDNSDAHTGTVANAGSGSDTDKHTGTITDATTGNDSDVHTGTDTETIAKTAFDNSEIVLSL